MRTGYERFAGLRLFLGIWTVAIIGAFLIVGTLRVLGVQP